MRTPIVFISGYFLSPG